MITEHIVNGSKETTLHTFTVTTSGMDITISGGEYYRGGQVLFSDVDGGTFTVPNSPNTSYEVFITTTGLAFFQFTDVNDLVEFTLNNKATIIDRIMWFDIGVNVTSLDNVEINFLKVIDSEVNTSAN